MAKERTRIALTADARLNLIIGLTTYLNEVRSATVAELANHFSVSEVEIRKGVSAMFCATLADSHESWAMAINDDWRENDLVELNSQEILEGNPRISARHATALATGLAVLQTSANPEDQADIQELIDILGKGSIQGTSPAIAIVPGTIDADLATIRKAITSQKRVRFEYFSGDKPDNAGLDHVSTREVDPIKLESNDQIWYARGYCHLRKEERSFRLDRMSKSQVLDIDWSDEARSLELSDKIYSGSDSDTIVTVDVAPEAYDLIGNFNADVISSSGANDEIKRIEMRIGYLPNLGKLISVYGGAAKVIAPLAARDVVRDFALQALGRKPLDSTQD